MNLIEQLKQIPDPRSRYGQRYPLWILLLLALLGSLCGYRGYRPLAAFCRKNGDEIQRVLALDIAIPTPCMSTFRRLLMQVSDQALAAVFHQWCLTFMRPSPGSWVGGDGKSIRCTRNANGANYMSTVTLFTHGSGWVIAFALMENAKASEIGVIRDCIKDYADIPELTFTLDALHCQKATVAQIVAQQQHYLVAVKGNQKKLYRVLTDWVASQPPIDLDEADDLSHGRSVTRTVATFLMPPDLQAEWPNSQQVVQVTRAGVRDGESFCHQSLYLTDHSLSARDLQPRVQGHWESENRLHWVRDVTFLEDDSPRLGGRAPVNWAILNCWLINLCRGLGCTTIPEGVRDLTNRIGKVFELLSVGFSSA
jgi:predicted transposase YbfD/YdcC